LKQKWLQKHPGQESIAATEEGQSYILGWLDPEKRNLPTLDSDSSMVFREKFPGDAKAYDIKEDSRVYENFSKDPAVRETNGDILDSTNSDSDVLKSPGLEQWNKVYSRESFNKWNNFVDKYPDKAKAYADKGHSEIKRVLEGRERYKQEQGNNSSPKTEGKEQIKNLNKDSSKKSEETVSADVQKRFQELESKLDNLTVENTELKNETRQMKAAMKEILPTIKTLLEAEQTREQEPTKKRNLAKLLLALSAVAAYFVFEESTGKMMQEGT
jgi:hypothetical protein